MSNELNTTGRDSKPTPKPFIILAAILSPRLRLSNQSPEVSKPLLSDDIILSHFDVIVSARSLMEIPKSESLSFTTSTLLLRKSKAEITNRRLNSNMFRPSAASLPFLAFSTSFSIILPASIPLATNLLNESDTLPDKPEANVDIALPTLPSPSDANLPNMVIASTTGLISLVNHDATISMALLNKVTPVRTSPKTALSGIKATCIRTLTIEDTALATVKNAVNT